MSVEVGQVLTGKVTGITHFGAFVDLGDNQSGLVHISQISDSFIKDINDVLSNGDEVEVKVLTVEDDGKISLTMRHNEQKEEAKEPQARPQRPRRPQPPRQSRPRAPQPQSQDFDQMMNNFLRDSEDRLASIRRNTEGKRGGRGGRRN